MAKCHDIKLVMSVRGRGYARAALDDGLRRELAAALQLSPAEVSSGLSASANVML